MCRTLAVCYTAAAVQTQSGVALELIHASPLETYFGEVSSGNIFCRTSEEEEEEID